MHCSIKRKIVPFGKTLFMGGAQLGRSFKKFNVFGGGQEENVSSKENPPVTFINERSLNLFILKLYTACTGSHIQ